VRFVVKNQGAAPDTTSIELIRKVFGHLTDALKHMNYFLVK